MLSMLKKCVTTTKMYQPPWQLKYVRTLLFQFVTEGFILLLAVRLLSVNSVQEKPESYQVLDTTEEKQAWLERLSLQIVDRCWRPPNRESISLAMEAMGNGDPFPYCTCREGNRLCSVFVI